MATPMIAPNGRMKHATCLLRAEAPYTGLAPSVDAPLAAQPVWQSGSSPSVRPSQSLSSPSAQFPAASFSGVPCGIGSAQSQLAFVFPGKMLAFVSLQSPPPMLGSPTQGVHSTYPSPSSSVSSAGITPSQSLSRPSQISGSHKTLVDGTQRNSSCTTKKSELPNWSSASTIRWSKPGFSRTSTMPVCPARTQLS
jgi:hypothetical protein